MSTWNSFWHIHLSISRDDSIWQLESLLSPFGAKVLDFKDNCLTVSLRTPILAADSVIYEHKLDCTIDSFVSDHELLIELNEGINLPKKVQVSLYSPILKLLSLLTFLVIFDHFSYSDLSEWCMCRYTDWDAQVLQVLQSLISSLIILGYYLNNIGLVQLRFNVSLLFLVLFQVKF
jgi:hypothetical protein